MGDTDYTRRVSEGGGAETEYSARPRAAQIPLERSLRYSLNLLKEKTVPRHVYVFLYRCVIGYLSAAVVAVTVLGILYLKNKLYLGRLSARLAAQVGQDKGITGIDQILGQATVSHNLLRENITALSQINGLRENRVTIAPKLERLSYLLPPKTWIESITLYQKDGRLVFTGVTILDNRFEVTGLTGEFIRSLTNDTVFMNGFQDVRLLSSEKKEIGHLEGLVFQISCSLEEKKEAKRR